MAMPIDCQKKQKQIIEPHSDSSCYHSYKITNQILIDMKLGTASQIMIGTHDISHSLKFWTLLGFRELKSGKLPIPWVHLTDDSVLLLITEDNQRYMGIGYFASELGPIVQHLKAHEIPFEEVLDNHGKFLQVRFRSPDNFQITIIRYQPDEIFQPQGKTLSDIKPEQWQDLSAYPKNETGLFGELCHPVKDLEVSLKFWKKLGFEGGPMEGGPYPWAHISDGMQSIGLHQTTEFNDAALTYFAPDMGDRIKALKSRGVDSFRAFTGTGADENNQVALSPESQQVFLFNG